MEQIDLGTGKVIDVLLLSGCSSGIQFYIGVGLLLLLLFFYLLISGVEAFFFSASIFQTQQLKESDHKAEKLFASMLEKPIQLFVSILLTKFVVLFLLFLSIGSNFGEFSNMQVFLSLLGSCFLIELFTKRYAKINGNTIARLSAYPMYLFFIILYPISILFPLIFGPKMGSKQQNVSLDEISDAIENVDVVDVDIDEQEDAKLLKGVVRFGETVAKEIMRSRSDVIAIEKSRTLDEVFKIIVESGYTRFPVYDEDLDHILGIIVFKDFFPYLLKDKELEWRSLMRPAFFVSENKMIDELLQEFQRKKIHFAIVVDEYGGTSGIVTLEDVLEEIVGEISDEYDQSDDEIQYRQLDVNTWEFEAKTYISDFCKILKIKHDDCFDEVRGDADSLGGLMLELLGRSPQKDDEAHYDRFTFKVSELDNRRILKLIIHIAEDDKHSENDHEEE